MKIYLKILAIAASIQLIGFLIAKLLDSLLFGVGAATVSPFFIGIGSIVLSMVISLILALKWCKVKRAAIITYLLLPTNYTLLVLMCLAVCFVDGVIDILTNLSRSFG